MTQQFVKRTKSHCGREEAPCSQGKENDVPINTGQILNGDHPETGEEANYAVIKAKIHRCSLNKHLTTYHIKHCLR